MPETLDGQPVNQSTPDTRPTIGITMTATDSHPTARRADTVSTTEPTAANASNTTRIMINPASSGSGLRGFLHAEQTRDDSPALGDGTSVAARSG